MCEIVRQVALIGLFLTLIIRKSSRVDLRVFNHRDDMKKECAKTTKRPEHIPRPKTNFQTTTRDSDVFLTGLFFLPSSSSSFCSSTPTTERSCFLYFDCDFIPKQEVIRSTTRERPCKHSNTKAREVKITLKRQRWVLSHATERSPPLSHRFILANTHIWITKYWPQ